MADARGPHSYRWGLIGGTDSSVFHIKHLDTADGAETFDDVKFDRLTPPQRACLNAYLHEYAAEYRYVGRIRY